MARAKKPAPAETESVDEPVLDEVEELEPEVFGPYVLSDEANGLMFGADPLIRLEAGVPFTTEDSGVAAFLDQHPLVERSV